MCSHRTACHIINNMQPFYQNRIQDNMIYCIHKEITNLSCDICLWRRLAVFNPQNSYCHWTPPNILIGVGAYIKRADSLKLSLSFCDKNWMQSLSFIIKSTVFVGKNNHSKVVFSQSKVIKYFQIPFNIFKKEFSYMHPKLSQISMFPKHIWK